MSLFTMGLIISALGILGVFLILTLFYITIQMLKKSKFE